MGRSAGWTRALFTICLVTVALAPASGSTATRGKESVASGDERNIWEPEIAVARSPNRIAVVVTQLEGPDVGLSEDGGRSWTQVDIGDGVDSTVVADRDGTFWIGHISTDDPRGCVVTRIPPGSESPAATVEPPEAPATLSCDKPMIDVDLSPDSPTYGRVRLAWLHRINAQLVMAYCDTRPEGDHDPARCDDGGNWTTTTYDLDAGTPQLWGPDMASGPDGKLYVVWNDRGRGTIEATVCDPDPATGCGPPQLVAVTKFVLVCSIPSAHAPGRPISNTPTIDVDVSRGPDRGTVYVTWSDVGSGTPCSSIGTLPPPFPIDRHTQDVDSYVAAAKGRLPSSLDAVRVYVDGDEDASGAPGAVKSDDFYPTVDVDPARGRAWVALYSSRLDETREENHTYVAPVTAGEEGIEVAPLRRVSQEATGFAGLGTDNYGEYMGLDVVCGWPFATWVRMRDDADALTFVPARERWWKRCGLR